MTDPTLTAEDSTYAPWNLIVCPRLRDSVVICDWERPEVVWTWARGELRQPHDAVALPAATS